MVGLYGDYIIPSSVYRYTQVLRAPELYLAPNRPLITNDMLRGVWARLRDRLKAMDAPTSMIEVTNEYAGHFYDMYINQHEGKHLTGDRVRMLLVSMPFLLRDLITPEVRCHFLL